MKSALANNTKALLLAVMILGVLGHNRLVIFAAGLLLLVGTAGMGSVFERLQVHGPTVGFVLLVSSLLTSFVKGEQSVRSIFQLLDWELLIWTLAAGIAASVLCKQGMELLQGQPELIIGLIIGSLAGVLLLKGIPVGPFVAAGITGLVLRIFRA